MPRKSKLIDESRTDFGAALGRCLKAMKIRYLDFAIQSGLNAPNFWEIIRKPNSYRATTLTQKWVRDKKILETLESINPEIFETFKPDLETAINTLQPYPQSPQRRKYARGSEFAELVASILTESKLTLKEFCKQSDLKYQVLVKKLSSNNISQNYLIRINFRDHLDTITGNVFKKYADNYDDSVHALPKDDRVHKRPEDHENQIKLGDLIKQFLRDSQVNVPELANNLGWTKKKILKIISGKGKEPSIEWVRNKNLYAVLKTFDAELFERMKPEFESWETEYFARYASKRKVKPHKEKPLKISVDFYNSVHDYTHNQLAAHDDTPESIKEKFRQAAKDLKIKDSFILSGACIAVITNKAHMNDERLTDLRILKIFNVINELYGETEDAERIISRIMITPRLEKHLKFA